MQSNVATLLSPNGKVSREEPNLGFQGITCLSSYFWPMCKRPASTNMLAIRLELPETLPEPQKYVAQFEYWPFGLYFVVFGLSFYLLLGFR